MDLRFTRHYTRGEARALLPEIRAWVGRLRELRVHVAYLDQRLARRIDAGNDLGGEHVNRSVHHLGEMRELLAQFERREIQLKDLERGLVDIPAIHAGREVFLCWQYGEEDVEYWHDLDAGYSGRTML